MLIEAEIWTVARTDQGNAVLVRPIGSDYAVPIFIGQLEAQSIIIGIGNVPMPRPLTHDLFLNVYNGLPISSCVEPIRFIHIFLQPDRHRRIGIDATKNFG